MEIGILYALVVTICVIVAGSVLLIIDNVLAQRKFEKKMACARYLIPDYCNEMKTLSLDLIKEMNSILWGQFKEDEE